MVRVVLIKGHGQQLLLKKKTNPGLEWIYKGSSTSGQWF